jgi:ATP-dependent protease HslVU (ClpYQ) peptidase subunit
MTVCVAALCDNGASCVVAADRMGVYGQGSDDEFMMDNRGSKIHKLSDTAILLHSGANRDLKEVLAKIATNPHKGEAVVDQLDRVAAELIKDRRNEFLRRTFGDTFDYKALTERALASPTPGPLLEAWHRVQKFDAGHFLLVAWDKVGAKIHFLAPPAAPVLIELDYFAIGSGGRYARAALTIQHYAQTSQISEALFQVYSAKRAAEIVYGVGQSTDMGILFDGGFHQVTSETIDLLEQNRARRDQFVLDNTHDTALKKSLNLSATGKRKKRTTARKAKTPKS